jgi:phage baseplate assembly protein W|tara:strand:- start:4003 stop:4398 length:396 start_codon:yes stop_codon:yes gene_type:complete
MSRNKNIVYSDLRFDLAVNPATDDLLLVTNEAAIEQSIKNLLNTNRYERVFRPDVGSSIRSLLFENSGPQTAYNLRELIYETIINYEPRCNLMDVIVEDDSDRNQYNVYITFSAINAEEPVVLDLILSRVR